MVAVGALIKALKVPSLDNVLKALNTAFAKKSTVIDINIKAVNAGYNYK